MKTKTLYRKQEHNPRVFYGVMWWEIKFRLTHHTRNINECSRGIL